MPTVATVGARGQASVELVAVVPLLFAALLATAQLALAGWGLWAAAAGARAGARVAHVGSGDPAEAAERAVPDVFGARAEAEGAEVRVAVGVPAVLPGLPAIPLSVRATLDPAPGS